MPRKKNPSVEIMPRSGGALKPKLWTANFQATLERIVRERVDEIMANPGSSQFETDFQPKEFAIEIRQNQTVFESRKWRLYFEKWGCRMCSQKTVLHAGSGCCEKCNRLVTQRLIQIKRDYEKADPEREIERQIDHITSRVRSARELLGEGEK
jgi:Zn finger protein HypA/HybF involved in hydrogenase expression